MLHNNNYFNNYMPYNMYYRSTPVYPYIEKESIDYGTKIDINHNNSETNINDKPKESISEKITSNTDRISLLGISLHIDDIIIICIIIFLFMETKKDYLLIIILSLMFFDISMDTFKNLNIIKQLFNPT